VLCTVIALQEYLAVSSDVQLCPAETIYLPLETIGIFLELEAGALNDPENYYTREQYLRFLEDKARERREEERRSLRRV